jgi:hypothetical protein
MVFVCSAVPVSALAYDTWNTSEYLEVSLMHAMLKDGADLIVPSFGKSPTGEKGFLLDRWTQKCVPILIYVISTPTLGDEVCIVHLLPRFGRTERISENAKKLKNANRSILAPSVRGFY